MENKSENFHDKNESIQFYEERYSRGYMEEWDDRKKQRVFDLVKNLGLGAGGTVLDFGCGNGVFTDMIQKALPGWSVWGVDISSIAIANAKERFGACHFAVSSDRAIQNKRFDLLFTHHVLEHVYDLRQVWDEMVGFLNLSSGMLHILPCGNEGSFEHRISRLKKGGINKDRGNRFFCDEIGHLRRLTTVEMGDLAKGYGFDLRQGYYANQFFGGLRWIFHYGPAYIKSFTEPGDARCESDKWTLLTVRYALMFLYHTNRLSQKIIKKAKRKNKSLRDYIILVLAWPLAILQLANQTFERLARDEWARKKRVRSGSEMYLYFIRDEKTEREPASTGVGD